MSSFAAGLLSGVALAMVFAVYTVIRRSAVLNGFRATDESIANIPESTLFYLVLGAFSSAAVLLGVAAGFAYGWLGQPLFTIAAFGAAIVLSVIAVLSRTVMAWDKVFWNLATGAVLGLVIPLLTP
jgi:hypothetical protein